MTALNPSSFGAKSKVKRVGKNRRCSCLHQSLFEHLESRVLLSAASVAKHTMHTDYIIQQYLGSAITNPVPGSITPAMMRKAYGIDQVKFGSTVGDGTGQTIAIVDAFNQPKIASDLAAFDAQFGLPAPPSLTVLNENGGTSLPGVDTTGEWGPEISLDVEWAHSIAPAAKIVLVEANSATDADLFAAVKTAAAYPGVSVVSMSFGRSELSTDPADNASVFSTPANHQPVTFLAATGDFGAFNAFTTTKAVQYPSASPNVVAVGGTTLTTDSIGDYISETAWGEGATSGIDNNGGGGGISKFEAMPAYQHGVVTQSSTKRTTPDVALDADPATGVPVYDSSDDPADPWMQIGGTSLACPMFAAIIAIADQGRILAGSTTLNGATQTLPKLYAVRNTDFRDITSGNNGFAAGTGYDLTTGIGTPIVNKLALDMIDVPTIASLAVNPSSVIAGTPITLSANGVSNNGSTATISSVNFYLETNGIAGFQVGDTLLGSGVQNGTSSTWTFNTTTTGLSAGAHIFYAVATDSNAHSSTAAAATLTVVAPTVGTFTIAPNPINNNQTIILTASNVTEVLGGSAVAVNFYRESNGTTGFQSTDTLVGAGVENGTTTTWTLTASVSGLTPGVYTYYAVATDAAGAIGPAKAAGLVINPSTASNNNFANAAVVTGTSFSVPDSNVNASRELGEPTITGNPGGSSVWWAWTAPSDGLVTINTTGSTFDTLLGVYTGASLNSLTQVAANNDAIVHSLYSSVTFRVTAGQTYHISVDGANGATGAIKLNLNEILPPSNDNFANALDLGSASTFTGSNVAATREAGEPVITGNPGGSSVWFTWTATSSGAVTINTIGSTFNTLLGVYTGTSLAGLTQVAANDDLSSATWASSVTFTAVAGTTYHIAIDGSNGASGNLVLNLVTSS